MPSSYRNEKVINTDEPSANENLVRRLVEINDGLHKGVYQATRQTLESDQYDFLDGNQARTDFLSRGKKNKVMRRSTTVPM